MSLSRSVRIAWPAAVAVGLCAIPLSGQVRMEFTSADAELASPDVRVYLRIQNPGVAIEGLSVAMDYDGSRLELFAIDQEELGQTTTPTSVERS